MDSIKDQLNSNIKNAMKARDQKTLTILRSLSAAIKQVEVDTREIIDDAKVIQIIQKEIKMRRDALKFAEDQSREDLISKNKEEIDVLQNYLGKQLSEEELSSIIDNLIKDGLNSIGAIMGKLNKEHQGQFEGKTASALIKSKLS